MNIADQIAGVGATPARVGPEDPEGYQAPTIGDGLILGGMGLAFLVVNLLTSELHPLVWVNEIAYADPAINLYQGKGFTSTAWDQPRAELWASNTPLYPLLLYPWLRLFGLGLTSVRSLNYVLMIAVTASLALAAHRLRLVRTRGGRVLLVLLVSCGSLGLTFLMRGGRPDLPSMFPALLAMAAWPLRSAWARGATFFLAGSLIPIAGLQVGPYVLAMALILTAFVGRRALVDATVMALGTVAGLAATLAVYHLRDPGSERRYLGMTLFSGHSAWPDLVRALSRGDSGPFLSRLASGAMAPILERSNALPVACTLFLVVVLASRGMLHRRSPALFAMACALVVPVIMFSAGKYPFYYAWMVHIPLMIGVLMTWEEARSREPRHRVTRFACGLVFVSAMAMGLPGQLAVATWDRQARRYSVIEELVVRHTRPGDRIFCDFICYYPAKARCAEVFLPTYRGQMTPEELRSVNVVILRAVPAEWEKIAPELARDWVPSDLGKVPPPTRLPKLPTWFFPWSFRDYSDLQVYVRRPPAPGETARRDGPDRPTVDR